jgi:hemoglobin
VTPAAGDIGTREDCERLVRAFYGRAMTDPIIGWLFTDVAKLDLEEHVPVIASFWETVLLGGQSYSGGTFRPHAVLHHGGRAVRRPDGR